MKKYEPKQMAASSRYRNYFPTLPTEIQQDVYGRMNEVGPSVFERVKK